MENASKALIMAGAVLIAILIISLGVMIFHNMSSTVANNSDLKEQEVSSINSKILPYIGENISGSQVNALIQIVYSIDRSLDVNKISISLPDGGGIDNNGEYLSTGKKKVATGRYYKVEIINYSSLGLISEIRVSEV